MHRYGKRRDSCRSNLLDCGSVHSSVYCVISIVCDDIQCVSKFLPVLRGTSFSMPYTFIHHQWDYLTHFFQASIYYIYYKLKRVHFSKMNHIYNNVFACCGGHRILCDIGHYTVV